MAGEHSTAGTRRIAIAGANGGAIPLTASIKDSEQTLPLLTGCFAEERESMSEGWGQIVVHPDGVAVARTAVGPVASNEAEPAAAGVGTSRAAAVAVHCCAVQPGASNEAQTQVEQASPVPAGTETGAVLRELQDALIWPALPLPPLQREDSLDARLQDACCPRASQYPP